MFCLVGEHDDVDDTSSIDDADTVVDEDLTSSQQDLRLLYRQRRAERLEEQETAERERQRLEDILRLCEEYGLDSEPTPPSRDNTPTPHDLNTTTSSSINSILSSPSPAINSSPAIASSSSFNTSKDTKTSVKDTTVSQLNVSMTTNKPLFSNGSDTAGLAFNPGVSQQYGVSSFPRGNIDFSEDYLLADGSDRQPAPGPSFEDVLDSSGFGLGISDQYQSASVDPAWYPMSDVIPQWNHARTYKSNKHKVC